MHEARIGTEPSGKIVNRFIAFHRFREPFSAIDLSRTLGKLGLVVGLKRDAFGI